MLLIRRRLFLLLALALMLGGAWLAPLDAGAEVQVQSGLKRALASFAAARTLNAVISVVQGTEISIQIAGLGPTFAPGQVLDPVNDLVEQFSTLMLLASVSFGIQLILLKFGAYWAVSALLSAAAIACVWLNWRGPPRRSWPTRLLLVLLLVRFAIPLVVLGSEAGFQLFLSERYAAGEAKIELSGRKLTALSAPPIAPREGETLGDRFRRWTAQGADVARQASQLIDDLKRAADETVEHIVMLVAVFLIQTLILPLALLWSLIRFGGVLGALTRAEKKA